MTLARNLLECAETATLAPPPPQQEEQFVMGLVADPDAPGPTGELAFNVYASIADDGTGYGTLIDPVHPSYSSDLRFVSRQRQGPHYRWEGVVTRSNDPGLVGQPVVLLATVHGDSASPLELVFLGHTFRGRGLVVIAIIAILIGLLVPAIQK
ncbi:MAG TPA: hypothetical protein VFZ65_18025 [Planctomycetota bacterium]|nr:hypothetical protein [Planctomycetota bacterium]